MADPRSLDALDPPPWGPAPADATYLVERCHDLRRKPIDEFEVEDFRVLIGQGVGLPYLVPPALDRLEADPLAEGDYFPGDLLLNVLELEPSFWSGRPTLATRLEQVLDAVPTDVELEAELSERIAAFRRSGRQGAET